MKIRWLAAGVFTAAVAPSAGAFGTAAIQDPVFVPVTLDISSDQTSRAIHAALGHRTWLVKSEKPGYIEATIDAGSLYAKIGISWASHEIRIKYLDSEGLGYDAASQTIAGKYNKWTRLLSADINTYVTLLGTEAPREPTARVVPVVPEPAVAAAPTAATAASPAALPQPAVVALEKGASASLRAGTPIRARASTADATPGVQAATVVTLKVPMSNADGRWWYVAAGDKTGWVLESELRAQP